MEKNFFDLPADWVAPRLLGQYLCRRFPGGKVKKYRIVEVEAYVGEKDRACHAFHGRTGRTAVMYGPGGHWYIYLIYGMYYMLNLVTAPIGEPQAVLFRAVEGVEGPGRLTKELGIGKSLNGLAAAVENGLWLEIGRQAPVKRIQRLPRVGIDYAGEWKDKLLRFRLKNTEKI